MERYYAVINDQMRISYVERIGEFDTDNEDDNIVDREQEKLEKLKEEIIEDLPFGEGIDFYTEHQLEILISKIQEAILEE